MATPRKHLISLDATPYYHCTSRCVRRAFLCGIDHYSGQSYEHRRAWVEDRILFLASVFAIEVCAYAVMSNHHHLVLHINSAKAHQWTDRQVCQQWHKLYKGHVLTQRFLAGDRLDQAERETVQLKVNQWRHQLYDISCFMKALNEPIARMANAEDRCTGRFWESRFKSQALLDEKALLACMAYVDLNPIRSQMAATPETSEHTSIKKRVESVKQNNHQPQSLATFVGYSREAMLQGLPFRLEDYLELVEQTGRIIRDDKRGSISPPLPSILDRLSINAHQWAVLSTQFEARFKNFVGAKAQMQKMITVLQFKRRPGVGECERLLN